MGDFVLDARQVDLEALLPQGPGASVRDETTAVLAAEVPPVLARWESQFRTLLSDLTE